MRHGTVLHRNDTPCLEGAIALVLVDRLYVGMEGQPEYAVEAVRQDDVLYLTTQAGTPTALVSDYVFGDDYEESAEDEDADRIRAFTNFSVNKVRF